MSLANCRRSLFQSRANSGQLSDMKLCTVTYVAQCKWNQKVVVDTCLPSQMIFARYTTAYFIRSKSEVLSKFMEYVNSVEKHTVCHITKLNILSEEDVKVLRSDNMEENRLPTTLPNSVPRRVFHMCSLFHTVHSKLELLSGRIVQLRRKQNQCYTMLSYHWNSGQKPAAQQCTFTRPTTALQDETPFESLFGSRPDISQRKIFGCVSSSSRAEN